MTRHAHASESVASAAGEGNLPKGQEADRQHLINKLNFINFKNGTVQINLRGINQNGRATTLQALPLPCSGTRLDCRWASSPEGIEDTIDAYTFENLIVTNGNQAFVVRAQPVRLDGQGISVLLPETCEVVLKGGAPALQECSPVDAKLVQHGAVFEGTLIEFASNSFRVQVKPIPPQTLNWLNKRAGVNLILSDRSGTLYTEECRLVDDARQASDALSLEPLKIHLPRFSAKEFRSRRQELVPCPSVRFLHPLTGRPTTLQILNISGCGFCAEDDVQGPVLLPGLVIRETEIEFANGPVLKCRSQVVYRREQGPRSSAGGIQCGMAILDMDSADHTKLLAILQKARDKNSSLCTKVDIDELWDFFFESGFIYPEKYSFLEANKDAIKATYERLYNKSANIGRHFMHQNNGRVLAHMSMLRFYGRAWLIHHHAATRNRNARRSGLGVLNQVGRFINDSHRLHSARMDYVLCYYRPENRFPDRIFGGIARRLDDPGGCSLDTFAYAHLRKQLCTEEMFPKGLRLSRASKDDLHQLKEFYNTVSGGLMLRACDLETPPSNDLDELTREYRQLGFIRERHLLSLKMDGALRAIVEANTSDLALNMSGLTNCLKVIVVDSEELPEHTLDFIMYQLSGLYNEEEVPVLLYPMSFVETQNIHHEKRYNLWVLNMTHTDHYFCHLERLIRFIDH